LLSKIMPLAPSAVKPVPPWVGARGVPRVKLAAIKAPENEALVPVRPPDKVAPLADKASIETDPGMESGLAREMVAVPESWLTVIWPDVPCTEVTATEVVLTHLASDPVLCKIWPFEPSSVNPVPPSLGCRGVPRVKLEAVRAPVETAPVKEAPLELIPSAESVLEKEALVPASTPSTWRLPLTTRSPGVVSGLARERVTGPEVWLTVIWFGVPWMELTATEEGSTHCGAAEEPCEARSWPSVPAEDETERTPSRVAPAAEILPLKEAEFAEMEPENEALVPDIGARKVAASLHVK